MRLPSTMMSTGPIGGAPVPSTSVAPRRISRFQGPSPSARGGAGRMLLISCARIAGATSANASAEVSVRAAREITGIVASQVPVDVPWRRESYNCSAILPQGDDRLYACGTAGRHPGGCERDAEQQDDDRGEGRGVERARAVEQERREARDERRQQEPDREPGAREAQPAPDDEP